MDTQQNTLPRSRAEARSIGAEFYFTGKPCLYGHVGVRDTRGADCRECNLERKRRFNREQPAVAKQRNRDWWSSNRERGNARERAWRLNNKDKMREKYLRAKEKRFPQIVLAARERLKHVKRATPPWADKALTLAVYIESRRLSLETGVKHNVDHIIPLRGKTVCGLHVHTNLRAIPAMENFIKQARFSPDLFTSSFSHVPVPVQDAEP